MVMFCELCTVVSIVHRTESVTAILMSKSQLLLAFGNYKWKFHRNALTKCKNMTSSTHNLATVIYKQISWTAEKPVMQRCHE